MTESGLNSSIHDGELIPCDFKILRCDRADGRKQGGVFLASSSRYKLKRIPIANVDAALFELVCATVYRRNIFLFMCCVVYIPPKSNVNEYMHLFNILETECVKFDNVLVLGDFNIPSTTVEVQSYMEYVNAFCGFRQVNNLLNSNNRTLDLVLSTLPANYLEVLLSDDPLVPIDPQHPPLVCVTTVTRRGGHVPPSHRIDSSANHRCWNFSKCNFSLLYYKFELIDWNRLYKIENSEAALAYFYDIINEAISECTPRKCTKLSNKSRYNYPDWYTADLINEIQRKWRYHKIFKISGLRSDYKIYCKSRSLVKIKISETFYAYQERLQINFKNDPKSFWSFIRQKQSRRNKTRITKDGQELSDEECAECFASYFHSVYSPIRPNLDPREAERVSPAGADAARVHVAQLAPRDVRTALRALKPKHSLGPDNLPPYIIKDCRMVFETPLLHIYNLCLGECHYPDRWKTTRVIPVPKAGGGSDVSKYRPIAVLSAFAKVFESILHKCIYSQVSARLSDAQHGFRPGRSTASNLLSFVSHLAPAVDAGGQVDCAYFDFQKAFDAVDNDVLLSKFSAIGFTPHLLKFFASYLGERRQYVEYGGYQSAPYYTFSGVSQGSNLGPLEFVIMINDLPEVVRRQVACSLRTT